MKNESDVRKAMRSYLKDRGYNPRWIEPALGSTQGLPDMFFPVNIKGEILFIELKYSKEITDNEIRYEVQPEQKREIPRMVADGMRVLMLIGMPHAVIVQRPTDEALSGRLRLQNSVSQQKLVWPAEQNLLITIMKDVSGFSVA